MWHFLKRLISTLVILAVVLAAAGYFCLQSKGFWQWAITKILPRYGYTVDSCTIGKLVIRAKPDSYLQNLRLELRKDDIPIKLTVADLRVQSDWPPKKGKLFVSGLKVDSAIASVLEADGRFDFSFLNNEMTLIGPVSINHLTAAGYESSNIAFFVTVQGKETELTGLQGGFYGGKLAGKILLESQDKITYSIDLNFERIDLKKLATVNPGLFGQVGGLMDGTLEVKGEGSTLSTVKSSFDAPDGGEMKAVLFNYILNYLPGNTKERKMLEQLIKANDMVPLSRFDVDAEMVSDQKIAMNFDLESKRLNLQPNVTVEVNLDEKISKVVSNLQKILPIRRLSHGL